MRKVCILATIIVILMLILQTIYVDIRPFDIITFIFLTYISDRIINLISSYIELRKERQKFELIIQKIEKNIEKNGGKISNE